MRVDRSLVDAKPDRKIWTGQAGSVERHQLFEAVTVKLTGSSEGPTDWFRLTNAQVKKPGGQFLNLLEVVEYPEARVLVAMAMEEVDCRNRL